jgi:hypothetical protein
MSGVMQTIWIPNEEAEHELDPRERTTFQSIAETMLRNIASIVPHLFGGANVEENIVFAGSLVE